MYLAVIATLFLLAAYGSARHASRPITPTRDCVMLAYINYRWHRNGPVRAGEGLWPDVPDSFLRRGDKGHVAWQLGFIRDDEDADQRLGDGARDYEDEPGERAAEYGEFYRDRRGTRFIEFTTIQFHEGFGEMVLSAVSRHRAKLVSADLTGMRTARGIGLGDTRRRVLSRMGRPTERDRFGPYEVLFYKERPKRETAREKWLAANQQAIFLRGGRVVEICLNTWSNEPVG